MEYQCQFSRSVVSDSLWPHGLQHTRPPITISRSLPRLMSIESVMPSNHLILCHPLLLPPSISPSIRVFPNESALRIRWPKYWSFSFNISPSNEQPGLISFRMDWLQILTVQGLSKVFSNTTVQKREFFIVVAICSLVFWLPLLILLFKSKDHVLHSPL